VHSSATTTPSSTSPEPQSVFFHHAASQAGGLGRIDVIVNHSRWRKAPDLPSLPPNTVCRAGGPSFDLCWGDEGGPWTLASGESPLRLRATPVAARTLDLHFHLPSSTSRWALRYPGGSRVSVPSVTYPNRGSPCPGAEEILAKSKDSPSGDQIQDLRPQHVDPVLMVSLKTSPQPAFLKRSIRPDGSVMTIRTRAGWGRSQGDGHRPRSLCARRVGEVDVRQGVARDDQGAVVQGARVLTLPAVPSGSSSVA